MVDQVVGAQVMDQVARAQVMVNQVAGSQALDQVAGAQALDQIIIIIDTSVKEVFDTATHSRIGDNTLLRRIISATTWRIKLAHRDHLLFTSATFAAEL